MNIIFNFKNKNMFDIIFMKKIKFFWLNIILKIILYRNFNSNQSCRLLQTIILNIIKIKYYIKNYHLNFFMIKLFEVQYILF